MSVSPSMSKARVGTTQDPNLYTDVAAMRETVVKSARDQSIPCLDGQPLHFVHGSGDIGTLLRKAHDLRLDDVRADARGACVNQQHVVLELVQNPWLNAQCVDHHLCLASKLDEIDAAKACRVLILQTAWHTDVFAFDLPS